MAPLLGLAWWLLLATHSPLLLAPLHDASQKQEQDCGTLILGYCTFQSHRSSNNTHHSFTCTVPPPENGSVRSAPQEQLHCPIWPGITALYV